MRSPCAPDWKTAMIRSLAAAVLLMTSVTAAGVAAAQSAPLNIQIDRSQRVALRGAAGSVIVGNPAIADVTVVDSHTLFITGKGYGVTEVVAVDAIGRTVFESQVIVTGGSSGSVRVWRGARATEMACAASCAPSIRSLDGDAPAAAVPTP